MNKYAFYVSKRGVDVSELGEVWLNMRDYLYQAFLAISIFLCLLSVYFFLLKTIVNILM